MGHIFHGEDYDEGREDFRKEIADYLLIIADYAHSEEWNLPNYLRNLSQRIRDREIP